MKRNACAQQAPDLNRKTGYLWKRARAAALIRAFVLVLVGLCGLLPLGAALAQGASQQQAAWRATNDPVFNAATAQFQRGAGASDPVSITVMLKLNNKAGLDDLVRRQRTPGDSAYHQWLSSKQSTQQFGPSQAQAQAVADYLQSQGFTNVKIAPNNLLVSADGTATLAQIAFNTQIGVFLNDNGETGLANMSAIQVPSALSQIDRVLGLNTIIKMRVHSLPVSTLKPFAAAANLGSGGASGYYPDQFSIVYNRPTNQTGGNTTVAIVGWGDMNGPISDLKNFEINRGLPLVPAFVCPVDASCSAPSASTQGTYVSQRVEWSMDAQAIVGISGGVRQLLFYTDSINNTGGGFVESVNKAVTDNMAKIINMSFGSSECGSANGYLDSIFIIGMSQGQIFAASSGDNGAYPCPLTGATPIGNGNYGNTSQPSVLYPSSSPYVVAVGGTMLSTNSSLGYSSESAWPYSGGGVSGFEPMPSWQSNSNLSGAYRQVPDLAFDADWSNSPIVLCLSLDQSSNCGWNTNGGTSLASPLFVGAWAVLESASNNSLDFAPRLIYPNASQLYNSSALHDVTTGNNGYYPAKTGYDNITGWGSFNIAEMLAFFVPPQPTYTITASAGTGGTISPSSIGGLIYGATKTFTVTSSTGYTSPAVSGTCGGTLSSNTYTTNAITANCTVTATFTPQTYTIVIAIVNGGTSTVNASGGLSSASYGTTKTFTITPASGYYVSSVSGTCGGTLNGNTYTTNVITANCTAYVNFAQIFTVTASANVGGTISPSGMIGGVVSGTTRTFTFMPNSGYVILGVGGTCGGGGTFNGNTFVSPPITTNCTIIANFTPIYTITASASTGGTISPSGSINGVVSGTTKAFTITPNAGYTSSSVGGTCGGTLSGNIFTTNAITTNCTITAAFTPIYTITASAGTGGTISPSGSVSGVVSGITKAFTITPNAGYTSSSVGGTCGGTLSGNTYTTNAITTNCTVTATFTPAYTVTASVGTGGIISPSGSISGVVSGTIKTFTITPSSGYVISSVGGTCGGTLSGSTYATNAITANCTVTAAFTPIYTIAASAGTGGTISPSGSISGVSYGATKTFTVTPNPGYASPSVSGTCGGTLSGRTYTTKAIMANCTVTAAFMPPLVVTASAGSGGTISPAGNVNVTYGTSQTFTLTPNLGYVPSVGGTCGGTLAGVLYYYTNNVTTNCTVTVTFLPMYTVIASAGTGGTISPSGSINNAVSGTIQTFTLTPASGYGVSSVGGTCGGTINGNVFTTNPITANCTVTAAFLHTYTVTASAGTGGAISPTGAIGNVVSGTTRTFTITPNSGYVTTSTGGSCGGTLSGNTYTTKAITGNCTVTAAFTPIYTVTASAGTGGSINPSGAISGVVSGTTKAFTITTNAGYTAPAVGGTCGGSLSGTTYTTKAITSNCTVTASFTPVYTITASAGTGGTISPTGASTANAGTTKAFTVKPNSGYATTSVGGTCGGTLNGTTYTTSAITANCTVTAAFAQIFTVTASAGSGGSISPSGSIGSVPVGTTKVFTVTPSSGYVLSSVGGTCGGTLTGNTYTTNPIAANCTVTAAFLHTYTVTVSAGTGGAISPSGAIGNVVSGTAKTFTVTPNAGYVTTSTGGSCGGTLSGNIYTTKAITGNCTVTAAFTPIYTVTASAGTGGAISPSGAISGVVSGTTKAFTITTNSGYTAPAVGGTCGGSLSGSTYTTKAITSNCTVAVTFTPVYTITVGAGTGGTISPTGASTVNGGTTKAFTVKPNSGYITTSVGGTCGGTLNGTTYTTSAITANCTVTAAFTQIFTVTASAGSGGSISPSGTISSVPVGTVKTFTVTPGSGYALSSVGGTCGGTLNGSTYTTSAITANCTVAAAFVKIFTVTASAGTGGAISPSGAIGNVVSGTTRTFTITPNSGYVTTSTGGSCGGTLSGNIYTTKAISGNCTVTAAFATH